MTIPKTTWHHSKKSEALRLLETAHSIQNHFYQTQEFLVLPELVKNNPKVVYFPNLDYYKIEDFWKKAKKFPDTYRQKSGSFISKLASMMTEDMRKTFVETQKKWMRIEKGFWKIISALLVPSPFANKKIKFILTRFGTICSDYTYYLKRKNVIELYLRADADISNIAEALFIYALNILTPEKYSFTEREAIIDFYLTRTSLAKLFPNYKPTLDSLRSTQQAQLTKQSENYLRKFGFPKKQVFTQKGNCLFIDDRPFHLTKNESKLFKLLIQKRKSLVNYDEFAEVLWGKDSYDKFSLSAITKTVERVRKKIKSRGIHKDVIQAQKGQGYIVLD